MIDISPDPQISNPSPTSKTILQYVSEAYYARYPRMVYNAMNWDCYHLRQDYSHKRKGQSKEFLAKTSIATEQLVSFLQQGLMDLGDWFRIEPGDGVKKPMVTPDQALKLLMRQLDKNKFSQFYADCLKDGLLESLMIVKVGGKFCNKISFEAGGEGKKKLTKKEKSYWQLKLDLVRAEDYFPDPTGDGLYEVQRIETDWHTLYQLAKENPQDFDMDAVEAAYSFTDELQRHKKSRETDQAQTYSQYRRRVTIYECWGNIIEFGTGKLLHENVRAAVTYSGQLIMPPRPNPYWHGTSPFVVSPIVRVPRSVWHKALMDAPTKHNIAINELYNLMVDGGMMQVFGIKQLHEQWLEDPSQVSEGIPPGETLAVNNSCPPGEKALERVDTAVLDQNVFNMFNVMNGEFNQSAMTNDMRMGQMPQRQVKATEIVASNQSLTGVFNGIAKVIEEQHIAPLLEKCWLTMAQYMNDLDHDEVKALIGDEKAAYLDSLSPEERFAGSALGNKYKVFGLSTTLNKIQDFKKVTALMQSIGSSPQMMQEFQKKYDFGRLLEVIMKSLDIDVEKLELSPEEQAQFKKDQEAQMQNQIRLAQAGVRQGGANQMSQVPGALTGNATTGEPIPQSETSPGMTGQPG
jgi:hypothetical protein